MADEASITMRLWDRSLSRLLSRSFLQAPPIHLPHARPPPHAREAFKLVALVDGVPTSIYDGSTTYPYGMTVHQAAAPEHGGGLYVYPSVEDCLAAGRRHFPRGSQLGEAPRAVARVLAWNEHGALPVSYGTKKSYSFVQVVALLPPPATWAFAPPGRGMPSAVFPEAAVRRPFSARGARGAASSPERLTRSQAATVRLELEVQRMEERLQLARSVLRSAA